MGLLENKLAELCAKDEQLRAELEERGAFSPLRSMSRVGSSAGGEVLDVSLVPSAAIAKAKAHIHAELNVPEPFVYEGHTIAIKSLSLDGDVLVVDLEADCPTGGPYRFVNPPLQTILEDAVMDDNVPLAVKTPRVTVDAPDAVLQTIVGQAVHTVALQNGWQPK